MNELDLYRNLISEEFGVTNLDDVDSDTERAIRSCLRFRDQFTLSNKRRDSLGQWRADVVAL